MKICGITAEYNPFHKGHAYQIEKARQAGATHILAVMSGNLCSGVYRLCWINGSAFGLH